MNYEEALKYVTTQTNHGIVLGLDNVNAIAKKLNITNPKYKVIHITGTNGKGSTGAFIASILSEAGYKVGHFSSPAILDRLDMICISGQSISQNDYAFCVDVIRHTANELNVSPTEFEVDALVAYYYFSIQKCDYAIIEVGMGGRLDATNFVQNTFMCVFTPIGIDHTAFLGGTLQEIATEKAGIIKPGAIVVSSKVNMGLIKDAIYTDKIVDYPLGMKGKTQIDNATLAVLACRQINGITQSHIQNGLLKTHLPSRFDFVKVGDREFVIDGAHNPQAGQALAHNVEYCLKGKTINAIIGMFRDKDIENTLCEVLPYLNTIYAIKPPTDRGLEANTLKERILGINNNKTVIVCDNMIDAIKKSGNCDTTLIFGSLSLAKGFYEWSRING